MIKNKTKKAGESSVSEKKLHLPVKYRKQIKTLFRKHLPDVDVWVYGSRVNGQSHPASDLDLVLRAPGLKKINSLKLYDLKEALTESNIPFLVEARDWALLPKSFHQEIKRSYIILIKGEKKYYTDEVKTKKILSKKPSVNSSGSVNFSEFVTTSSEPITPSVGRTPKLKQEAKSLSSRSTSSGVPAKHDVHPPRHDVIPAQAGIQKKLSSEKKWRLCSIREEYSSTQQVDKSLSSRSTSSGVPAKHDVHPPRHDVIPAQAGIQKKLSFENEQKLGSAQSEYTGNTKQTEIGEIPEEWDITSIKEAYFFSKKPKELNLKSFSHISFVPMQLIPDNQLFLSNYIEKKWKLLSSGVYFEEGDLLLSKITPSFENGKQCIIRNIKNGFGIATTEVIPIKSKKGVSDIRFLFYYLLLNNIRSTIAGKMEGTTGKKRIPVYVIKNFKIPLPPLEEQKKIVEILSKIQKAVEIQNKIIKVTKELKQTTMKYLFTYGTRGSKSTLEIPEYADPSCPTSSIVSSKHDVYSSELVTPSEPVNSSESVIPAVSMTLKLKHEDKSLSSRPLQSGIKKKPSSESEKAFGSAQADILQKIDDKISVHEKKKSTLEELLKTMLNQLMTGKIRTHSVDILEK